jgi:hypothetical protein
MSEKTTLGENGIYDARSLGVPKMLLLGLQHMFAMFGATILVPMLTGLDVSTTLLFAGLGTLLFHLLTKRKVPAFLGSSFAFLGGYAAIAPMADGAVNVAGKTGTAEQTASRPNHALFICYAPYENPEIAIATRIPFGYSSDYAAQFTRDIIKYYYGLAEEDDLITGTADSLDNAVSNEM